MKRRRVPKRRRQHRAPPLVPLDPKRRFVPVEEAMGYAHIGRTLIFDLLRDKKVNSIKPGRCRLVSLDSLDAYLKSLEMTAC